MKNDTFCRLPVFSVQCIFGSEKYHDSGILLNYNDDDYSKVYAQFKEAFRALTKDNILQPCKSDDDFRSYNADVVDLGFSLFVFDIRYQQNFTAFQPIKLEFEFD